MHSLSVPSTTIHRVWNKVFVWICSAIPPSAHTSTSTKVTRNKKAVRHRNKEELSADAVAVIDVKGDIRFLLSPVLTRSTSLDDKNLSQNGYGHWLASSQAPGAPKVPPRPRGVLGTSQTPGASQVHPRTLGRPRAIPGSEKVAQERPQAAQSHRNRRQNVSKIDLEADAHRKTHSLLILD